MPSSPEPSQLDPAATSTTPPDPAALQDALAAAIKAYTAHLMDDRDLPPFRPGQITHTDAAIIASKILKAAEIELFELSIFESWFHQ